MNSAPTRVLSEHQAIDSIPLKQNPVVLIPEEKRCQFCTHPLGEIDKRYFCPNAECEKYDITVKP
jgi:hypothetical protein